MRERSDLQGIDCDSGIPTHRAVRGARYEGRGVRGLGRRKPAGSGMMRPGKLDGRQIGWPAIGMDRMDGDRLTVNGIELETVRRGAGRPVLLLHGMDTIRPNSRFLDLL